MKDKVEKKFDEPREVVPGVLMRKKDSQKFMEDLINAGNNVWLWLERISHLVTPALVLVLLIKTMS